MGRFGLFGPDSFAITSSSVERCQFRFDSDVPSERPVESPPRRRSLEAREPAAGIGASPRLIHARHELPIPRREAQELALRRLPAAADATPDRLAHAVGASPPLS